MGWKGTLRSINSSLKAMEREAQKRQRDLARQEAAAAKLAEQERAAYEVAVYENRIEALTSVHREHSQPVEWSALANLPEPEKPTPITANQDRAQARLDAYKPGLITRALGMEAQRRTKLKTALDAAQDRDRAESDVAAANFEREHSDWLRTTELATGVVKGDAKAMIDAIREIDPFSDISELGSSVVISATGLGQISAVVHVNGEDVIPREAKTQLKSGKLSVKALPKGKYYDLYQDYVCGSVLRVGSELLALLPVDATLVTAATPMLNPATGHIEEQAVLSVFLPRATVETLNLGLVDPSDSMANFSHRMEFKKTKGFKPIQPLTFDDFTGDA